MTGGSERGEFPAYVDAIEASWTDMESAIAGIVARQDAGQLTTRQAADERITVMTRHLAVLQVLRRDYLGETGPEFMA